MVKENKQQILAEVYQFMRRLTLMYSVKVVAKIYVGYVIVHSVVVAGDGFHNTSDIFTALMLMLSVWLQNRPPNRKYPYGLYNISSMLQVVVYFSMILLAYEVFERSVVGILQLDYFSSFRDAIASYGYFLPKVPTLVVDEKYFWLVFGLMFVSSIVSFFVGWRQIALGKKYRLDVIVSDGWETISDGFVETVAWIGILGEYRLGLPWIEYPLGLALTLLLLRAAMEIGVPGIKKLLQAGVEPEIIEEIYRLASSVHGVEKVEPVEEIKSFRIGNGINCDMKITTSSPASAHGDMELAIAHKVGKYFEKANLGDFKYSIMFVAPDQFRQRVAYAVVVVRGLVAIAPSVFDATHLRICDMVGDNITRPKDVAIPCEAGCSREEFLDAFAFLMKDKYTKIAYSFGYGDSAFEEERRALETRDITLERSTSFSFGVVGLR